METRITQRSARLAVTLLAFVCIAMCTLFLPANIEKAAAATTSGTCGDSATYSIQDSTLTISGKGDMGSFDPYIYSSTYFQIKTIVINEGITSIPKNAFFTWSKVESVKLPNSLKTIGEGAFYECSSLKEISLGSNLSAIGEQAFQHCESLTSISLPSSIRTIGAQAFSYCKALKTINLPSSVQTIESKVFCNCESLTSISLPGSLRTIGTEAFYNCKALKTISLPSSVQTIESKAFSSCDNLSSIELGTQTRTIGEDAFFACKALRSIVFPKSISSIGHSAFNVCDSLATLEFLGNPPKCSSSFPLFKGTIIYPAANSNWSFSARKSVESSSVNWKMRNSNGTLSPAPYIPAGYNNLIKVPFGSSAESNFGDLLNYKSESKSFVVDVPKDGKVTFSFSYYLGNDGWFMAEVKDYYGNVVLKPELNPLYNSDPTYNLNLKKGTYYVEVSFLPDRSYIYGYGYGSFTVSVKASGSTASAPKVEISKLAKGKKCFTVKWKKLSKANLKKITGFQVRYSMKKSMKGAKIKTVKKTTAAGKKCALKVSKLKGGKKYYVQVRTYKKASGKTTYSKWSKAKTVKVSK